MNFKSAYSEKNKTAFNTIGLSMTKQNHKDECNINFIMKKYQKTGLINHANTNQGDYGEYESMDFQEAMNYVISAQETFDTLPSSTRKRFANSPHEFLQFVTNPENLQEMQKMGLANAPQPEPDLPVPPKKEPASDSE